MSTQTRLSKIYTFLEGFLRKKIYRFQILFTLSLLWLFVGFVCGSLFATFLPFFREVFLWDGLIIMLLLSLSEFLSYLIYHVQGRKFLFFEIVLKNKAPWEMMNIFKTGVFFGLFVDAFKVGS
jgi:sensor histidine kinase YesM